MVRATKRDVPSAKGALGDDGEEPRPHATRKTWPPAMRAAQPALPLAASDRRPNRLRNVEARDRERDERLKTALGWYRFETWCDDNGFRTLAATRETIATVALYMTYLAATGRSVAINALALLRQRDGRD